MTLTFLPTSSFAATVTINSANYNQNDDWIQGNLIDDELVVKSVTITDNVFFHAHSVFLRDGFLAKPTGASVVKVEPILTFDIHYIILENITHSLNPATPAAEISDAEINAEVNWLNQHFVSELDPSLVDTHFLAKFNKKSVQRIVHNDYLAGRSNSLSDIDCINYLRCSTPFSSGTPGQSDPDGWSEDEIDNVTDPNLPNDPNTVVWENNCGGSFPLNQEGYFANPTSPIRPRFWQKSTFFGT